MEARIESEAKTMLVASGLADVSVVVSITHGDPSAYSFVGLFLSIMLLLDSTTGNIGDVLLGVAEVGPSLCLNSFCEVLT